MARLQLTFPEDQYYYTTLADGARHRHQRRQPPRQRLDDLDDLRGARLLPVRVRRRRDRRDGTGIIVTDLATTYRAEAHARDQLLFEVGVMDFNKYGGDIIFRITRPKDKKLVAMAKQGFVFFNYKTSQVVAMAEDFRAKFERVNWID
jgi:acyl-CoA thioesterase FadM